jgi:hypothetical protein
VAGHLPTSINRERQVSAALLTSESSLSNDRKESQADILRDELVETEVHLATVRVAELSAVACQVEDVSYSGFLPEADL